MIKSFKTFWKDLYKLNKDSWIWMKKTLERLFHLDSCSPWRGVLVVL